MTVSEFACAMYNVDIVKDKVVIIYNGLVVYDDRMEFLRYAHESDNEKWWFAGRIIQTVTMCTGETHGYDYHTTIFIGDDVNNG